MRPENLLEVVRTRPFAPFRIHVRDGLRYDVHHPGQMIVLRSRAVPGAGRDNGLPYHLEHLALLHVVRLEVLPTESSEERKQ
jgi:hypothetical protein